MVRLWLIRHLPPDVASGVCYGQTDLALRTPLHEQADTIAQLRQQLPTGVPVFSSPLRRCSELAQALTESVAQDDRLKELHFGDWEMQTWDSIGPQALDAWAADLAGFRPPGGETGYEVQQRVLCWLQEVSQQHQALIVVTHAGVIRALQAHHLALPGAAWLSLKYDYGQLVCLEFTLKQITGAPVQ